MHVMSKHAKMPLSIDICNNTDSLTLSIEWAAELINDGILIDSLKKLYCSAFSLANQPIYTLDLLSAKERNLIASFGSGEGMPPAKSMIIDRFE